MSLDTLAYIKTRSPLKVSLIFAFGILVPSGILGFIGLRSYQYEQRWMQKESEERYGAVADVVQKHVAKRFSDLATPLRTIASQPGFQNLVVAQILPVLLSPPPVNDLSGYNLFVFDESDRMVAPWQEGGSGGSLSERQELDWGPIAQDVERLERMEFVDKDFAGAIRGYNALLSKTSSPALQAALLKNIAGDYRKLHDVSRAAMTYLKLARSYEQVHDLSGFPMGILGRQTAIKLYEEDKAWDSALDVRLDLFEGLLYRRWKIPRSQIDTLLKELQSAIEKSFLTQGRVLTERKPRWNRLRSAQEHLERLEEAGKRFAEQDRTELLRRVYRQGRIEAGVFLQIPSGATPKLAVALPILVPHSDRRRGLLLAVLPAETVWSTLNETLVESTQGTGLQVEWDRPGSESKMARHLWKSRIEREIDSIDPPLRFRLIDAGASTRDLLFKRRQWVFGGIIGLSFVVILVGIAIMAQALKREIEVSNLKADFVANVSHELRTPLTVISQIEEKLNRGRYRSEEEKKEIYSLLGQQTGRLRGLVEDVLDFSKILAGKKAYQSEPLELVTLVQNAIDLFEPKAEARGFQVLTYYPSETIPIVGDAKAITQAILNLVDNAMKYSGESRKIEVWVKKTAAQGIITVKDYGLGIATANQDKIFEKFYRIEDKRSTRLESGVGLGLAMVKHVIEGHKGKIVVESQVGKGSIFSLHFPLVGGK